MFSGIILFIKEAEVRTAGIGSLLLLNQMMHDLLESQIQSHLLHIITEKALTVM